jgi:hypothetical protein
MTRLQFRAYEIVSRAVEEGVKFGLMHAYKHTDSPSRDGLAECVEREVMLSLDEVIDFGEGDEPQSVPFDVQRAYMAQPSAVQNGEAGDSRTHAAHTHTNAACPVCGPFGCEVAPPPSDARERIIDTLVCDAPEQTADAILKAIDERDARMLARIREVEDDDMETAKGLDALTARVEALEARSGGWREYR